MGTFIIGGIVALLFIGAIMKIVKDRKKGGCSGCSSCHDAASCHKE